MTPSKNARMRDEIMELLEVADLPMAYADDVKDLLDHYYPEPEQPPEWAKDCLNDDAVCRCGGCGGWMTAVRPGKHQCDNPRCPEPEQTPATLGFDREAEKANPPGVEWTRKAVWSLRMSLVEGVNALCDRADAAEAKLGDFEFSLGVSDEACVRALNERDGQKARADALEQERDRLKEALERYGVHDATCDKVMAIELDPENNEEAPCSCGLLAALAAAGGEGASDA